MIISRIIGGLGNQMFQYAFGRALADHYETELRLDISAFDSYPVHQYALAALNIRATIATSEEIARLKGQPVSRWQRILRRATSQDRRPGVLIEEGFSFTKKYLTTPDNSYLEGYWGSEKYFLPIANHIRKDFEVKNPPVGSNEDTLERMKEQVAVSLHVRRGDYITNSQANKFHGTTSLDFYQQAVEKILAKAPLAVLYVFSDDPVWVKENLHFPVPMTFVDWNDRHHGFEDLRLMRHCQHHILANSTFSWWGAWLAEHQNQIVVAPQAWFQDPSMSAKDLLPERWIKL